MGIGQERRKGSGEGAEVRRGAGARRGANVRRGTGDRRGEQVKHHISFIMRERQGTDVSIIICLRRQSCKSEGLRRRQFFC